MSTYLEQGYNNLLDIEGANILDNIDFDQTNVLDLSNGINNSNSETILGSGSVSFPQTTMAVLHTNEDMKSNNFVTGSAGWRIQGNGTVEFSDGTFRGALSAATIDIGGADASSFHVDINGNLWSGAATYNIATNPFAVSSAGVLRAVSGTIANWTLSTTAISTGAFDTLNTMYFGTSGLSLSNVFKVTSAGVLTATSGTIGGCALGTTSIGSTTFVSGPLGSGWNISNTGTAEFQNATIRGIIRTSVFEKDTISAVNGIVLISSSDVLSADMTALDASTLTISGETTFSANEVIRIKDGTDDEWMLVTNAASAPTYTVTRDLAGSYVADTNPIWKKGTAVVSMGVGTGTKTGFVLLDSSSTNSPYIDIYGRNSNTYSDYTIHGRFGWLKGITDADVGLATTDVWGLYTDNAYIKGVIVANTGYIGGTSGWIIAAGSISSINGGNTTTIASGGTNAFIAGPTGIPTVSISHTGVLTASGVIISGALTATSGAIGGWTIGATSITDTAGLVGMSSAVTAGDDIRFWAGHATPASGLFKVTEAGVLTASSAIITGEVNATSGKFGTSTNYWSVGATGLTAVSASTDVIINYGKTDFGQDATGGFILGYDFSSLVSKFEMGSSATKIFKYDGTDISLIGGTITGGTIQTASGTGRRIVLDGTNNALNIYDQNNNNLVNFTSASSITGTLTQYSDFGGLLLSNVSSLTYTSRLIEANVTKTTSSGLAIYASNVGSGATIQSLQSGTGTGIYIGKSGTGGVALDIVQDASGGGVAQKITTSTTASSLLIDHNNSTLTGVIDIDLDVNDGNNCVGMRMNIANVGAGLEYAFDFEGSEYDGTKTSVSGFIGVLRIMTSEGAAFIPIYDTAS